MPQEAIVHNPNVETLFRQFSGFDTHLPDALRVGRKFRHCACQGRAIPRLDKQPVATVQDRFPASGCIGGDDGATHRHGFQN